MLSQRLKVYSKEMVAGMTRVRRFETKIGEVIQTVAAFPNTEQAVQESKAKFVLVGVPEDIGIRANYGKGGVGSAWNAFLDCFLNFQSNDFFDGSDVLLLGHLNFAGVAEVIEGNAGNAEERIEAYRHSVNSIDDAVEQVVKLITACQKIPIVISGGHHNAYGCIKGAAKGCHKAGLLPIAQINIINLDPHAEYSPMAGRHSGNAFRYADEDGYLEKYCVVGLHENLLPQNCWLDMANDPFFDFITYEDIYVHQKQSFEQAVRHAVDFTNDTLCGIELDLDAIQGIMGQADGISSLHARQYLHLAASQSKTAYLHIAEGKERTGEPHQMDAVGSLLGYLVSDFIKAIR